MRCTTMRATALAAAIAACGTSSDERAVSRATDALAPNDDVVVDEHRSGRVVVEEGTNIAATISPDRKTIIVDLHGALFSVPAAGGVAVRLTPDWLEPSRPDFSPRGDLVAFQAYAGGTFHVWVMHPDGSGLRRLTSGHGDDREPRISTDGKRIAFASDRAFEGSYDVWIVDIATGELTRRTSSPADEVEPAWSPSRDRPDEIAFVSGSGANGSSVEAVDGAGKRRTLATTSRGTRISAPSVSPDGTKVAYVRFDALAIPSAARLVVDGKPVGTLDDVFPFAPVWLSDRELLYTANGGIQVTSLDTKSTRAISFQATFDLGGPRTYARKRYAFDDRTRRPVQGIVSPALSPDGTHVVFEALNQLWLMPIGGSPRPLTSDGYFKVDPAFSPDGKRIVYGCDRAGTMDLWIMELATGDDRRLTKSRGAEVAPAWSPDGRTIAFQDQKGATAMVDVASGDVTQLEAARFAPGRPSWSADGKTLAFAAVDHYTRRFREGTNRILTLDVASRTSKLTEPAPFESISSRGDDGPVYSPDGSAMAFVMNGVLWVRPVDEHGRPSGTAVRIRDEAADAPSWSRDGKRLLYLSNGHLRLVDRDGSHAETVPLDLGWQADQPDDVTVLHAGRLWDGTGPNTTRDVDVLVDRNRITSISPHRADAREHARVLGARYVDASDKTVVPGLWEPHTHHLMRGKLSGDRLGRLWLAYGFTSLFSMADPAYRAVETREAFASGARIGPRFFATGEALDGERVYYNVTRPVTSSAQLALELSRADALGYDMVKTYVRLPAAMQAEVARVAHERMGIWTGSHYMLPGLAAGVDGMTHISATTRTGFAYTRSATGRAYADVPALLVGGGMFVMTTPFESAALYAEDPGMADDPRLLALRAPWDHEARHKEREPRRASDKSTALRWLEHEVEIVDRIVAAGGTVLAASDSPLADVATAIHMNLRAQVKFGREPWEALQTATSMPAKAFGLTHDLGSLEPGKLADLVIVDGDPLTRIEDLARVDAVMCNGRLHRVADLIAPFASPSGGD